MLRLTDFRSQLFRLGFYGAVLVVSLGLVQAAHADCNNPANAIVAENCLQGNDPPDWSITGSGDPTIQGFATDISVNAGKTVYFKINTNAVNYVIEIYRMGYYNGSGARRLTTINPSVPLPQIQPNCVTDTTTKLYDCGNWGISASWQVPATAVSGIYFAHLIRQDNGGDSHIYFIVRNDTSQSDILYQTSDLTWQAYNDYGGHSLYGPQGEFDIANRGYKVSYNRPFDTRNFEAATFLFNAEYPMVRFLEANGYNISYFTGVDAVRNASLIQNHKIYMSSGHDEYWAGLQRANVQAARDAGVNLAFFSGNEMFWKTRWENSIDGTSTPYRTLVCYKETIANAVIDPLDPPTWTGTWRDPSFSPPADGGRPENAVTGTLFKVNGVGADNHDLSIKVPAADGAMRFWRNTAYAHQSLQSTAVLPQGTLGYEWDVDVDNGFRPAGLFDLATATYKLTTDYLQDYGATYGAGTATHHLTMYRAASGALVFGAGTVQWAWGLDANHDGDINPNPDPNMQQATVNLLADMGAQPGSLQAGLLAATASTDTVPPVSTIASPAQGTVLQAGKPVTISGTAIDYGGGVVGGVEVSFDAGQTWHPAMGRATWSYTWLPSTVGPTTLMSRAVDDSGNLENPMTSGGNPGGGVATIVNPQTCPCIIWDPSLGPTIVDSGDNSSLEIGVKFRSDNDGVIQGLRFYKAPTNIGTHIAHIWSDSGTLLGTATFSSESPSGWQQVTFNKPVPITANTTYIASYFAPSGHYSADAYYFQGHGFDDPPLHALASGVDGQNGVYVYSSGAAFPSFSYLSSNYWVDVVFVPGTTFGISGTLNGVGGGGATVTLTGNATETITADASGNYSFAGLPNGSYTVTPIASGVTFTPGSQTVTLNGATITGLNFTGVATQPRTLSGNISGPGGLGATVTLSGMGTLKTTADSSGNYSFTGLLDGSYVVTPILSGFIYTPATQSVTLNGADNTGVNFSSQNCGCVSIWPPSATPAVIDSKDGNPLEVGVRFRADLPGFITGLRFYKAPTNTGTHIGHIWSNSGALLGSATFSNETASGWQQVTFGTPVFVSPNTTYVASYFAPVGHYSVDSQYFAAGGVDNPPIHALADGVDGTDGIFSYGTLPAFPTLGFNSSNYWVDVVYIVAPTFTVSGTISGTAGANATVTLSGMASATTTADSSGNYTFHGVLNGAYVVTPSNSGSVFAPSFQSVTVNGASVSNVNFTVPQSCPCYTIWPTSTPPPSLVDSGDGQSVEVGVKFRSDTPGYIVGLRFYKSSANTGTHIGNLWTSTGALLGTATFTTESGMGWQQVLFSQPVPVDDSTTYVASYFAPSGHYSANNGYFATNGVDSPPLHALAEGVDGSNGVYRYGFASAFPTSSYQSTNYWIDVIYTGTQTYNISGNIRGPGGPGAIINLTGSATATASADGAGNYTFNGLANGSYTVTPSNGNYIFAPGAQSVTINNRHALGVNFSSAAPTYTVSGTISGPGGPGAALALMGTMTGTTTADGSGNYSFSGVMNGSYTVTPSNGGFAFTPPNQSVTVAGANVPAVNFSTAVITYSISGTISGSGGAGATVALTGSTTATTTADANGNFSFGGISNGSYTVTPSNTGYIMVPVSQAVVVNGAAVSGVNFTVPQNCPCSTVWPLSATPSVIDSGDGNQIELGVRIRADFDGYVTGARFYKAAGNTGTHIGNIWSSTGTLLGTASFVGESSSGWQQVIFASPIPVTANTTYVVSYFAPAGNWSVDNNYFSASGTSNPPLHALQNGVDGPNGVYTYSSTSTFPTSSYQSSNYWVDVVYANPQTYSITGTISGPGGPQATVSLSGTSTATTTADASGNFSFSGLANGTYTTTPTNGNSTFTPATQTVTINHGHALGITFSSVVSKTSQTINFGALSSQTYGASPITLNATASSGLLVTFTVISGPATVAGNILTITGAGSVTVEADQAGNSQYLAAPPVQQSFTVNKAMLTVTAANASAVYGGVIPAFTYTATGFVNGDTQSVLSGLPSLTSSGVQGSPVGTYTITAAQGTLTAANYAFTFVNGVLTISRAVLTVTANSPSMSYGSTVPTLTYNATGFVNGDTISVLSGNPSLSTTATSKSPAGAYPVTISAGTLAAANYTFNFVAGTLTVTKVPLTVTANNATAAYGNAIPTLTYTITGFVNGDTQSVLTGAPVETTTAIKGSAAGAYPITISAGTLSAANYTFVFASGKLTITQRVLTVTAKNATSIYGAALPVFTYSVTGFVNGDTQSVVSGVPSFSTVAQQGSPAGTYPINITTGTLSAANYTFTFVGGTLTINKAVLTSTAKSFSVPYGTSSFTLTYTFTGFVNGDSQSAVSGAPTLSTTAQQGSQSGSYPINITAGTLTAANYGFKFVAGTLTITKVMLTVTANNATAVYNQPLPTLTYSISGFVNGDTQSIVSGAPVETTTAVQGSRAGIYTVSISAGSLTAVNYTFRFVPGILTITKAVPVISWNPTLTTITHGTRLGSGILDAVVTGGIPGTLRYTATVNGKQVVLTTTSTLPIGVYVITVTFTPTDGTDYTTATAQATITAI